MSYADDLAKDRDKYRAQRNQLARMLETLIEDATPKNVAAAKKLLRKIEQSDPIANAVSKITG
jgi:hypothetical protein